MESEITIHDEKFRIDQPLKFSIGRAKKSKWRFIKWFPKDALKSNGGHTFQLYDGKDYDKKKWTLIKNGWSHDHCMICHWHLCNEQHQDKDTEGYFNNKEWLCQECYNKFIRKNQNNNKN